MAEQLHHRMSPRPARGDRGSVLPLVAMSTVMMLVMVALAIDLGEAHQEKGYAQSSTDAAALAGAQALAAEGALSTRMAQAVSDSATWAFRNLSLTKPAGTTPCDGNANKTCFVAGDSKNTRVEITTPYTTTKTKPDGTSYNASELVHVKTCWDNPTFIARVIGISSIRVCSEATARGSGVINQNTSSEDEVNDPFTKCSSANKVALWDTAHWFPTANPAKDIPGKNNFGGTYLFNEQIDPASVRVTVLGESVFTLAGETTTAAKPYVDVSPGVYLEVVPKPAPNGGPDAQGRYKWEIKLFNFQTIDASGNGKDNKNFRDTLPDGLYTFAIHANTVNGHCNQTLFNTVIGKQNKSKVNGPCQEDLFRGGTTPPSGTQITDPSAAGRTVTATYYDETPPFTNPSDSTDATVKSHMVKFEVQGGIYTTWTDITTSLDTAVAGYDASESDFPARFKGVFIPNSGHEFQWKQVYKYVIPSSFMNGEYSFRIQVYDSDQNKAGGDCGYAIWTIQFAAGVNGTVELIE